MYVEEHAKILRLHGVLKVGTSNDEWVNDANTYVIVAESMDGKKIYGGARLKIRSQSGFLPIEQAIGYKDSKIHEVVDNYSSEGTAEICGLWNSMEVAGLGIGSIFVTRVGVSITKMAKVKSLFCLCSPATVKTAQQLGYEILESVGDKGRFIYPKEDLVATALIMKDCSKLKHADENVKNYIMDLRDNPKQMKVHQRKKISVNLHYELFF